MPVIETEAAMRKNDGRAKLERFEPGVTSGGTTVTATNVQDAINQVAATAGGGSLADAPSDGTVYGRLNAAWSNVLPLTGGTLTGALTLNADPASALQAATKQYVDTHGGLTDAPSDSTYYGRFNATWANVAPLASPTFTGTPAAPTPTAGDNTTKLATTAFVQSAVGTPGVVPENSQSANYPLVLSDAGKVIHHPASDASARTFTIPANASVAYSIGTVISFTNLSAGAVTIAITTDTMYLAGTGTTGSRTLAQYGCATALKTDVASWIISGTGLT